MNDEIYYLDEIDLDITTDIIYRKEFQIFKRNIETTIERDTRRKLDASYNIIPEFLLNDYIRRGTYLKPKSYQLFVGNYFNPNTPYSRLLLKWETGMGKTIAAISIALEFINYYQRQELSDVYNNHIGSVYIIGFTQQIFRNELLQYPEFGFISRDELTKLNNIKKLASTGNPIDIENLKKFNMHIKKRLSNRIGNGFFKFIGYKELANHLFITIGDDIENIINKHSLSETELKKYIDTGKIKLNMELLAGFQNSLIICDEIHNVYNSTEKNNWGVAIQVILNYHQSCRALFLSATPINNSPTEIIDLLNLLLPRKYYPEILRSNIFDKNNNILKDKELLLKTYLRGRVSFLRDENPKYLATKSFIGESIKGIDFLKFIRCPMSKFHYNTYKSIFNVSNETLGVDEHYLNDFTLPDPKYKDPYSHIGLFKTNDIKTKLQNPPTTWKNKFDVSYNNKNKLIVGEILHEDNLKTISNKYFKMIKTIKQNIIEQKGKMFIFHNVIHISGTLLIQEILLNNGIISETGTSSDYTLCSICGKIRKEHSKSQLFPETIDSSQSVSGGDFLKALGFNEQVEYHNNVKIHEIYSNNEHIMTLIPYEDVFILPSRGLFYFDKHIDAGAQDTDLMGKIIIYISLLPIIVEINNEDTVYIKMFKENNHPSSFKYNNYTYFYAPSAHLDLHNPHAYIKKFYKYLLKKMKHGGKSKDHYYQPARFVIIHSDLDKKHINRSMENFNNINNIYGNKFMIIIGSKIIKESYTLNSIRNVMIMYRPDNISTLIQIIGRAVRIGVHSLLPVNQRHVNISIFVSSIPDKSTLSYEEQKYKEKINTYKSIQTIEKIMHENAIDAYFNYDIIWQNDTSGKSNYELGALPYQVEKTKMLKLSELNLHTFNVYYATFEVKYIMYMLKRFFIEISSVWTYNDLFQAVLHPPFVSDINSKIVSKDLFNIGLNNLLYLGANDENSSYYIESKLENLHNTTIVNLMDKLQNPNDKIIILPNGKEHVIIHSENYYILVPLLINNDIQKDIEVIFRPLHVEKNTYLNITDYLKYDIINNFNDKKLRFINKWKTVSINNLELAMCDFGVKFHEKFLEEIIRYIFKVWTDPKQKKDENHVFYVKMLYYYDLQKIVLWAHTINDKALKSYLKYVNLVNTKLIVNKNSLKIDDVSSNAAATSGLLNMLKQSINTSDPAWVSTGMITNFESKLNLTLSMFTGLYKKSNTMKKVNADLLPVGHIFDKIPRFYIPDDEWINDPHYIDKSKNFVENNIIIGYDSKGKTGMNIKFKIRSPIQNIKKYIDTRLIEKGSICASRSKPFLISIAKKIDIDVKAFSKLNVENLCSAIRTKLIYYELKERMKNSNKKFFYFSYEDGNPYNE